METVARALHSNLDHWGIIVSKRVPIGEIVKRMLNLLNSLTADEMQHRLEYLTESVREIKDSPYGTKYIIKGMLNTPKGTSAIVETVWIIESGKRQPRFVTAYPAQ